MSLPADRSPSREGGLTSTRIRYSSSPHSYSGTAAERLTDDLLVEILSRAPAKSLCRFKCISKHWLNLIDHPDHRKKLPQTMAGFFYTRKNDERCSESNLRFFDVSESRRRPLISPSFDFLPTHRRLNLLDGCNGLLLCRWYDVSTTRGDDFRYVVCNPATEEWVALPDPKHADKVGRACLGFDPAVSSHFHVFLLLLVDVGHLVITGVDVYSSETRRWVHKERGCEAMWLGGNQSATVFLNGYLHFHTMGLGWGPCIAAVDTEGETWTIFDRPRRFGGFMQQSQGRLHYANFIKERHEGDADIRFVIHVMEDYDNKEWTLKHSILVSRIFGGIQVGSNSYYFHWIAIHPDSNLIFFTGGERQDIPVMCCNMDRRQAKLIPDLRNVCPPYVPYVPLYSELQSLHM